MPESAPRLQDPAAPSFPGDLLLAAGAARALLRPRAGGRVARLWLATPQHEAVEVLHPYDAPDVDPLRWAKGGIYPLVPYSNRIAQARLRTPDGTVALAAHPDAAPHTLHGPAHGLPWQTEQAGPAHAVLALDSPASPAWPGRYRVTQDIRLTPDSLSLRLQFTNLEPRVLPAGLGFHPYFRHRPSARLRYRAAWAWDRSDDFLATGARPLPESATLAAPAALPPGTLTDYFSGWS
ncbi:MAG: hypothetical protein FGM55_13390, partial [Rhodoferax sp.]|nr:hypothetical protein [Rhodoferax sp.]